MAREAWRIRFDRRTGLLGGSVALAVLMSACERQSPLGVEQLAEEISAETGTEIAIYYRHLGRADSVTIQADLRMHAASTMKVPVMIQLFRDHEAGLLNLDDPVEVTRTFHSIVDGSQFDLDDSSDSELTLYGRVGEAVPYRELNELMITASSNLATNLLIERLDAERVTETARVLGADSIEVLRGVEDIPAFEAGLSNSTTARDLGALLVAMGDGRAAGPEATQEMIEVLKRQQFNEKIPAGLPDGTVVAHKTGNITRISHDAAIVSPGDSNAYVLVVLTRGFDDPDAAAAAIAQLAGRVHARATTP